MATTRESVLADAFLHAVDHGRIGAEHVLALLVLAGAVARRLADPAPALALVPVLRVIDAREAGLALRRVLARLERRRRPAEVAVADLARRVVRREPVARVGPAHARGH